MKSLSRPTQRRLSHIDSTGQACMVDVSSKPVQHREAMARGEIWLRPQTLALIGAQKIAKGNVLGAARVAGILAAKRTDELVPLCHSLPLAHCAIEFTIPVTRNRIVITTSVKTAAQTGVEMEALTAVAVAALTIYDMCKAVDPSPRITGIRLLRKIKRDAA